MKAPLTQKKLNNAAGISVLELLIVVAMISVLSGFALLQIVRARQVMTRNNAAQQLASFLEKARLDSVRRRPYGSAMAQVSIADATSYSVTIDADGNGALNAPQVVSLPTDADFKFNGPFPRTIYFDWRGRPVDISGNPATPLYVIISSLTYGSSRIDLSGSGQPSLQGPLTSTPVNNASPPVPVFRPNTQILP